MTSSPPWGPDIGQACTATVIGIDGYPVEASAAMTNGPPGLQILGLPDSGTRETRDRVRAAIINSGQPWPGRAITVDLLPASLPKRGSSFDLAIAVAVLTASGVIPAGAAGGCVFVAELGLDGSLRPVRGVVPALLAAADAGCIRAVVAAGNAAEAVMVPGLAVVACQSLRAVLAWLRGDPFRAEPSIPAPAVPAPAPGVPPVISLAGLGAAPHVRLALEASAAGGHHICLAGPRGARIPALAAGLTALLPALSPEEVMEVSAIYSAAGLLGPGHAVITRPPLRAPHHTATRAAILGGGPGMIRPGEAALAHRGVLFLDDAPEFGRDVLAAMRQPLQNGEVIVARGSSTVRFPAKFTLVAGMAPCPCGAWPECRCSPLAARRYRARVAGELGGHLAICLHADATSPAVRGTGEPSGDGDLTSAARVAAARDRASHRFHGTPWQVNAGIPGAELHRFYAPAAEAVAPLRRAVDLGEISTRAAHQVIRVAWTLADLAGNTRPGPQECGQALAFHLGTAR
jgi:magnesium chelatase family protein